MDPQQLRDRLRRTVDTPRTLGGQDRAQGAPSSPASHCSPSPAPPVPSARPCGHWWPSVSSRQSGAAALTPASLGLLINALPAAKRQSGVRIWAAAGAAAAAFGPVVGGILVEASWRWVFLINVPVGIVLLYFAVRRVPDTTHKDPDAGIDFVGAALLTVGIGSLALALVQGPDWGWTDNRVLIAFAVAAVTLLSFWWSNSRHRTPLDCSGSSEDPLVCLVQRHRHPVQRSIRRGSSLEHPLAPGSLGILGSANRFRLSHRVRFSFRCSPSPADR